MYSQAFHTLLIDARVEDLSRARGTSRQWLRSRKDRSARPAGRWWSLSRSGLRRLELANPSRAN
jgi:hypothetical protein